MGPADLQRYHKLLLKKQRELSSALLEAALHIIDRQRMRMSNPTND